MGCRYRQLVPRRTAYALPLPLRLRRREGWSSRTVPLLHRVRRPRRLRTPMRCTRHHGLRVRRLRGGRHSENPHMLGRLKKMRPPPRGDQAQRHRRRPPLPQPRRAQIHRPPPLAMPRPAFLPRHRRVRGAQRRFLRGMCIAWMVGGPTIGWACVRRMHLRNGRQAKSRLRGPPQHRHHRRTPQRATAPRPQMCAPRTRVPFLAHCPQRLTMYLRRRTLCLQIGSDGARFKARL